MRDDGADHVPVRHQTRRRPARRSLRPFVAAGVLGGGLVLASAFAGVTIQENALAREIRDLNAQITLEQGKQASLEQSAAEKKTTDYVVDKAKSFGFVWPWEALIAVQRDANASAQRAPVASQTSRIMKWIALFIGTR